MNIDDYMDMQHDLAEADVIAFENEIDYLHKELELYKKALYEACGDLSWEFFGSFDDTQRFVDSMLERAKRERKEE